jgi:hypothetical protein
MGNIAAIIGTIFLARLMDVDATLPLIGATKNRLAFPVASLFVILAVILLVSFVREKPALAEGRSERMVPFGQSFRTIFEAKDKSAFLVLVSLFLWFVGYQGVVRILPNSA